LKKKRDKIYNRAISKINEYNNQKEKIQEERRIFSSIEDYVNIMERMQKVKKEESGKKILLILSLGVFAFIFISSVVSGNFDFDSYYSYIFYFIVFKIIFSLATSNTRELEYKLKEQKDYIDYTYKIKIQQYETKEQLYDRFKKTKNDASNKLVRLRKEITAEDIDCIDRKNVKLTKEQVNAIKEIVNINKISQDNLWNLNEQNRKNESKNKIKQFINKVNQQDEIDSKTIDKLKELIKEHDKEVEIINE
jgi:hypothetical protein